MKVKALIDQSKFWLGDNFRDVNAKSGETLDLLRLAAYRRAIGNFVYILTGKNIPVRFAEKSTSMTDGKVIYIGGELSKGEFDPTVGLCLHEAMHIVKSDFDLIKTMWGKLPRSLINSTKGKMTHDEIGKLAKYVLNIVEDRYIDAWAYEAAPGYRGYYRALYNRYFNLPEIDAALKSDAYRNPTVHNYKFRLTNIVNHNTDLDALPALRRISELLDLQNILRSELSSAKDRLELAYAITEVIVNDLVDAKDQKNKNKNKKSDPQSDNQEDSSNDSDDTENDDSGTDDSDDILGGENSTASQIREDDEKQDVDNNPSQDLTAQQIAKVDKLFEKQEKLVLREQEKNAFDSKILDKLQTLEKSGTSVVPVGNEEGIPKVDCIVVQNMTRELMESGDFPFTSKLGSKFINNEAKAGVEDGIALGIMLGRKLQIRGEVKTTKLTRLLKGKIDRRLLAQVGFQGEDLFYQTTTDKFKTAHLHISVDASSSMCDKWKKTMTSLVAIAKAASMVNNVSVSISFRSGALIQGTEMPYIVMAYDSRKDKFSKITNLFPMLFANGSTPEGLAFQAIVNLVPASSHELDSYFVNISDGEPAFRFIYHGKSAALHTRKQVQKIRANGVSVLSYFIDSNASQSRSIENTTLFKIMYGRDAQFIDVENVTQVAITLNRLFLTKES
jgi:hypothetical protein